MNIAIILAGGAGTRVGAQKPKQFIEVLGKPLFCYTIEKFEFHPEIDFIEFVCVESYIDFAKRKIEAYGYKKVRLITPGGCDFQHSVMNGIYALEGIAADEDVLLIHWAASPFVEMDEISDAIRVCKEKGNCIAAFPAYLLYGKKADDGDGSIEGIDRDTFMVMNAPQCFLFHYVREMYDEAQEKGLLEGIDPHTTTLMYSMGRRIFFSKGRQSSIKITTEEDFDTFLGYLLAKEYHKG